MKVFRDMDSLPTFMGPVVTVGAFDGVHRGHLHLLDTLNSRARASGGESVVVTFARHPRQVLHADEKLLLLSSLDEKIRLLEAAGVDNLVIMPFDGVVAAMSPEEFVRDFLVARLGVRELVVGYNHRLGRGREGSAEMLRALGESYGFGVFEASKLEDTCDDFLADGVPAGAASAGAAACGSATSGGGKISSTEIRKAIARGDVRAAEKMLGRKLNE